MRRKICISIMIVFFVVVSCGYVYASNNNIINNNIIEKNETIKEVINENQTNETKNELNSENKVIENNETDKAHYINENTTENDQNEIMNNEEINLSNNNLDEKKQKEKNLIGEQSISNGTYEIQLGNDSSKAIDVIGNSNSTGANVQIYTRNDANCQRVNVKYVGDGYYTLQFKHSNKYLDVCGENTADGTNVWQWDYNGCDAQKWLIKDAGDGYYYIISKCSETYLTVENNGTLNFTNIEINHFKNNNSQKFRFNKIEEIVGTKTIEDGLYEIEIGIDSNKAIDVVGSSKSKGKNVQIYEKNGALCQQVEIKYLNNGYYTIKFRHSGMYLDVCGGENLNGTNVWQWEYNGCDAQKWIIKDAGNERYNIISKCGQKYLTVKNGKKNNGTNIEIFGTKGDESQAFKFNKVSPITGEKTIADGTYEIQIGSNNSKAIDVIGNSNNNGANVQIYARNDANCQRVNVKYIGNGYYTLQFKHSGKYLDVCGENTADGTNVWQWNYNGCDAQKWIIKDAGDGYYYIISKCSERYLTVANNGISNFTNIEINRLNNNNSQKFRFNKIEKIVGNRTIEDGLYEIETGIDSNKAIEISKASSSKAANVQIYAKNNALCQQVEIKYLNDGYYSIKFRHSDMYLDVCGGEESNGANVWQWEHNGCDAQKWIIKDAGDGYYNIISKCGQKYLSVKDGKKDNGTNIEIFGIKGDKSQKFKFNKVNSIVGEQTISDGTYEIQIKNDNSKVIEVSGSSHSNGANVQIYQRNTAICQKINVKYIGDGYYTLQFKHSKKYLDVCGGSVYNGTNVWQWEYNGCNAQKWIIKDAGDGYYYIISKCSEKYLTINSNKTRNGTNIEINSLREDEAQKFKFNKVEEIGGTQTITDGLYEIETGISGSKAIDVLGGSKESGANVQIYTKNNASCQKVKVKYIGNGYYTMSFYHSDKYLDVRDGLTANGTNVWQWDYNGSDAQKWIIKDAGDGYYYIISKCSESYLTVFGGINNDCTNIEISTLKNDSSQKFKFNEIKNMKGLDVSAHNGIINWERVKNSGIDFAIIRCGYGENLTSQDDQYFNRNISECERLGIPYGVYIYSYALTENGAVSEANHVLRLIKGHNPSFGIWFDMEDADHYKERNGMPSNQTLVNICKRFCDKIKENGYNVGIYASLSWLKNQLDDPILDVYPKWVAQWNITCTYTKKYVMWQYTNSGVVDGITGYVDMNKYYM